MSTSFTTPAGGATEWESDVEDSNSSEEFMYVKGTPPPVPSPDLHKQKLMEGHVHNHSHYQNSDKNSSSNATTSNIAEEDIDSVWNTHEDKVPVSSNGKLLFINGKRAH